MSALGTGRRERRSRGGIAAAALAAALVATACGSNGDPPDSTTGPAVRPSSTASISIVEPQPGETVAGGTVTVRVELEGARLVREVSTNLQPDEGHIHVRLDGETITILGGLTETIPDVEPGQHVLEVEFVAADHGFFDPRVVEVVSFSTEAP
jgi:hypothetical protein